MLGGSGSWQITQTKSMERLGIDCVIDGRSESAETIALFHRAIEGSELPQHVEVDHPTDRHTLLFPDRPTTFGVVEMTTGCGRRCQFCVPDLNPQIDLPKDGILDAVRANVVNGNKQISLATEDMFILGPGAHQDPVLLPEPRGAGRSLPQRSSIRPGLSSMCSATRRWRPPWSTRC